MKKQQKEETTLEKIDQNKLFKFFDSKIDMLVIDDKRIAKINERMPAIIKATQAIGRKNTQTTSTLMTLTMLCDSPYRRLRQVLVQIERKRQAIESSYFTLKENKIKAKLYRKKGDELSIVKAERFEYGITQSKKAIEQAFKEIGMFQDIYDEIRDEYNIPDDWDELDSELDEIKGHIKMAFRHAIRDILAKRSLGMGTLEYLEQYGIHPQTALQLVTDYLDGNNEILIKDGKFPTVDNLYIFLDKMADQFSEEHKRVAKRIGVKNVIKNEWLYKKEVS